METRTMDRAAGEPCYRPWLDISGRGVRTGIYSQAILVLVAGVYCLWLAAQPQGRGHTWARKALSNTGFLVLGGLLHVYVVVHTSAYGLSVYDVSVHSSLSWILGTTTLLVTLLNFLLTPLDDAPDALPNLFGFSHAVMLFAVNAITSALVTMSPEDSGSWCCLQYGSDPSYALPVLPSPRLLQVQTFLFDVVLDHLIPLFLPYFSLVSIWLALTEWAEHPGPPRIPKEWRHLDADPLRAVSRSCLKIIGGTQIGLILLCAWATKEARRVKWSIALCIVVCGAVMAGLVFWTEMVVAAIERPTVETNEELWKQRFAFSLLTLPAVMMIPRLWLMPYITSVVSNSNYVGRKR
ncbi:hypothetical protein CALVIDRAFT_543141 [Calocera viscosa TUFC12733]|uniref:Uncharacterized protein n=1 Tax=Calocera viscosa (strain TUFC12733) TaxID=1330018 RepID=A0A167FW56_CALVF|nr:hypothetical protein CALVIDRAFT_543141 [Calocera viscosa TUFC12733]